MMQVLASCRTVVFAVEGEIFDSSMRSERVVVFAGLKGRSLQVSRSCASVAAEDWLNWLWRIRATFVGDFRMCVALMGPNFSARDVLTALS